MIYGYFFVCKYIFIFIGIKLGTGIVNCDGQTLSPEDQMIISREVGRHLLLTT